jgi:hypothetical protein
MANRQGVDIDEFNAAQGGEQDASLTSNEVDEVRDLLTHLPRWETLLNTLQTDQTLLAEGVAVFANRVETHLNQSDSRAVYTHQRLEQVIEQMQQFANQCSATMTNNSEQIRAMRGEMDELHSQMRSQRAELAELRVKVATMPSTLSAGGGEATTGDLYPEWDVLGDMPPGTPEYSADDLESRIAKSFKQKETPVFTGEDNDDIDVYARNMMLWYGAFGLFFRQPQVDFRVGQLMMNHTKGKPKAWLLQEYTGEWRWSCIAKKMRQRFLTKSREEVDCLTARKVVALWISTLRNLFAYLEPRRSLSSLR